MKKCADDSLTKVDDSEMEAKTIPINQDFTIFVKEIEESFGWGKSVVQQLSSELQKEFVAIKGFSVQNLWNMRQFYLEYYQNLKLQTLSREIGWLDNLQREFYIKSVIKFGWSYRVLANYISKDLALPFDQYSIRVTNRDDVQATLKEQGIPTAVHYPMPLHLQEAFAYLGYEKGDFPVSEIVFSEIMSLPMNPYLGDDEISYVTKYI